MATPESIVNGIISAMDGGKASTERSAVRFALRIGCALVLALTEIRDELVDIGDELEEFRMR